MVRFLCLFGAMTFAAMVIDMMSRGGPFGGFFVLICWWSMIAFVRYRIKQSDQPPSLKMVAAVFGALLLLDLAMGDRVHLMTLAIQRTASHPFDGTVAERQAHVIAVWQLLAYVAVYGVGILVWLITLFPGDVYGWFNRVSSNLLTHVRTNKKELAAYLIATLVALVLEFSGQGPLRAVITSMGSFLIVALFLEHRAVFRIRTMVNWSFALFLIAFVMPQHARAVQRLTIFQAVIAESSPSKKLELMREFNLPELDEEFLREMAAIEAAKVAFFGLSVIASVTLFKLYWIRRGLEYPVSVIEGG